ncbi:MmgE/PrpD family protein [Actinophytocola oryzae]|uniref:2-methylcitrate dehydratase PrpD n=1 Tax=Actinophytocola oryzae TaxID=502181 RepID=A0A4R7W4U1_9PSEU|nr:MmgE/PrpD family protein [Actinophytocola oryzae]TDV57750.1 2-methylcitrate dehydratase PrpD [Actinophytocola oryzae]
MTETVSQVLGRWVSAATFDDLPPAAIATATRSMLDCWGVTLAALGQPITSVVDAYAGKDSTGTASLVGLGRRATPETAAFVNASVGHALDFDDVSHTQGGHPTVAVLPAAFAAAEAHGATGKDLLLAFCVGVEITTKIARGVNFVHYDKGWHPTATLGVFGAAAAVAKLVGMDAEQCATALGMATAMSSGLKSSFGTMAKPLQVGRAAQSGVQCANLVAAGATAKPSAFEEAQGFATVFNGVGNFDLAETTGHLGAPWDLDDPGIAIKLHPCCGGTHAAVDAAITLHDGLGRDERVARVDAYIHPRRFAHLDRPGPDNPLDAKFSLQHTVALALTRGEVRIDDFTPSAITDADVVATRSVVRGHPLPEDRLGPEHFAAEVHLTLADGATRQVRMERPRGRTQETALTDDDIRRKFTSCTRDVLGDADRDRFAGLVAGVAELSDVDELAGILRGDRHIQ